MAERLQNCSVLCVFIIYPVRPVDNWWISSGQASCGFRRVGLVDLPNCRRARTYPNDVGVLLEALAAGRHIDHLAPDAGLAVLADGGFSSPTVPQRHLDHVFLQSGSGSRLVSNTDPDPGKKKHYYKGNNKKLEGNIFFQPKN